MIPTKIIEQNLRITKKDKTSQECRVWITSNTIQLGIPEDPEYQGIKGAYRILVMRYIWFLTGIKKSRLASCLIVKINEAYENLSDKEQRNEYDRLCYFV